MDKIQDKATKFLNDVRIKKCAIGKKTEISCNREQLKNLSFHNANLSSNICCYCQKVFIGPKFLVKHIYRRHPENLISLYKKCSKLEINSSGDTKSLLDFIQDEFTKLKKEILIVKQVNQTSENKINISREIKEHISSEYEQQQLSGNVNLIYDTNVKNSADDITLNELKIVKENVLDLENNVTCLHNKMEGLQKENSKTSLKQEIINLLITSENEIMKAHKTRLVELKYDLMKDVQTMLNKESSRNDNEMISQFMGLNEEIKKLHNLIDVMKKKIDAPDYLEIIEKKLEQNIINFLGSSNRCENTVAKTRNSYFRKNNKRSVLKNKEKPLRNEADNGMKTPHISKNHKSREFYTDYELSCMLADKMSLLGISPDTSKLSCKQYEEKMKLIEFEKKQFSKQNKHFLDIYNKINKQADEIVTSKLKKKTHKIRFSEPLTMKRTVYHSHCEKNFPDQILPMLESKSEVPSLASNKSVYFNSTHWQMQSIEDLPVNNKHFSYTDHDNPGNYDYFENFSDKLKSKHDLQSTPLEKLEPCASDYDKNSDNNCFPNSADVCIAEKNTPIVSNLKDSELVRRNMHQSSEYMLLHSKNNPEKSMNFSEHESSLESLSSWEDYINNS